MFSLRQPCLDAAGYRSLVDRCQILERDYFGEKVLKTPEGLMVKIFRRKRFFTTATFFPYALRFIRNTRRLAARGIVTVSVVDHAYCPELQRHLVTYHPLEGKTLRDILRASPSDVDGLLYRTAGFIATLHQKGVYFRSLHFGNIVVSPDGENFGLIDVADMTFRSRSLSNRLRVRNFRHILRCGEDAMVLERFGFRTFVDRYVALSDMSARTTGRFVESLVRAEPVLPL